MKTLVANFSKQLSEAIQIGRSAKLQSSTTPVHNVLIAGLGGSGIGGTIVSQLTASEANVPITSTKGYFAPEFVNQNSLVIVSSYSGNTEETLQVLENVLERGAKVVCITSGGKVENIAKEKSLDLIKIPGGMPPRACLAYSLTQLFYVLAFHKIISNQFESYLEKSIALIDDNEAAIKEEAQLLANNINGKLPVIYTTTYKEGVAIRFRQQINENAKLLCWHHVFPEMNHNELVGWKDKYENIAVIMFRDANEYSRNNSRFEISKEIISKCTSTIFEINALGTSEIEKSLYLIHLCDWVSVYLAEQRNVDAVEVNVIDHLKSELSKR